LRFYRRQNLNFIPSSVYVGLCTNRVPIIGTAGYKKDAVNSRNNVPRDEIAV